MTETPFIDLQDGCRVPSSDEFGCKWAVEKGRLDWDDQFRDSILNLIPQGGFCVDGGACVGMCSKLFSDLVGPTGFVLCFEPNKENLFYLHQNIGKFQNQNTFVCEKALGSTSGYGISHFKPKNVGESDVVMKFDGDQYPIEFTTLDQSVRQITTRKVDFLKLDVEGWEFFVLVGGWNLIRKDKPILFVEINPNAQTNHGCSPGLIQFTLNQLGYQFEVVQKDIPENGVYDLLCKSKE